VTAGPGRVVPAAGGPAPGPGTDSVAARSGRAAGSRLLHLHLISRQLPMALVALAGCGLLLAVVVSVHWTPGSAAARQLPVLIEGGAAALIAVTTRNPFGEPERVTGPWLPYLRSATAIGLTAVAVGVLVAASVAGTLPGGGLPVLRNVAGMTGIGLLCAPFLGGARAWLGPLAYLAVVEYAFGAAWTSPWTWPVRPPHDAGAAVCAGLVFALGSLLLAAFGPGEGAGD
jgi:hypothetical protein